MRPHKLSYICGRQQMCQEAMGNISHLAAAYWPWASGYCLLPTAYNAYCI